MFTYPPKFVSEKAKKNCEIRADLTTSLYSNILAFAALRPNPHSRPNIPSIHMSSGEEGTQYVLVPSFVRLADKIFHARQFPFHKPKDRLRMLVCAQPVREAVLLCWKGHSSSSTCVMNLSAPYSQPQQNPSLANFRFWHQREAASILRFKVCAGFPGWARVCSPPPQLSTQFSTQFSTQLYSTRVGCRAR